MLSQGCSALSVISQGLSLSQLHEQLVNIGEYFADIREWEVTAVTSTPPSTPPSIVSVVAIDTTCPGGEPPKYEDIVNQTDRDMSQPPSYEDIVNPTGGDMSQPPSYEDIMKYQSICAEFVVDLAGVAEGNDGLSATAGNGDTHS